MNTKNRIEILAPCGGPEHLQAAVYAGADAVYVGVPGFSARRNAVNFSMEELREAIRFCHGFGVRVYAALNILIRDAELSDVRGLLAGLAEMGPDALIVQDLGLAHFIRASLPELPLHASTQMSVHTLEGARFCAEAGFERVVIARECDRRTLEAIAAASPCGIEVFVHGALCVSVSGQCTLSAMIGGRSGNRGLCAQPCRLDFSYESRSGSRSSKGKCHYALSLKDLSLVRELPELQRMGVQAVKIEGRMKRPEYVAAAVTACRAAMDNREPDLETLRAVFSRQGFTQGYYTGSHKSMQGTRTAEDARDSAAVLPGLAALYEKPARRVPVDMRFVLGPDRPASLCMTDGTDAASVSGPVPETARTRPVTEDAVSRLLARLGDTPFELRHAHIAVAPGLALTASQINAMRREACGILLESRIQRRTHVYAVHDAPEPVLPDASDYAYPIRVHCRTGQQADAILNHFDSAEVTLPVNILSATPHIQRVLIEAPRFTSGEDALKRELAALRDRGFTRMLCQNPAHILIGRELGFELHGGFGLNVFNGETTSAYAALGLVSLTASFELKASDIRAMRSPVPLGLVAYGRLPLMLLRRCPFDGSSESCDRQEPCNNCPAELSDRTGRHFPMRRFVDHRELLNADTLWLADRELPGAFRSLVLHNETPEEARAIVRAYLEGCGGPPAGFTRGLYWRGVE